MAVARKNRKPVRTRKPRPPHAPPRKEKPRLRRLRLPSRNRIHFSNWSRLVRSYRSHRSQKRSRPKSTRLHAESAGAYDGDNPIKPYLREKSARSNCLPPGGNRAGRPHKKGDKKPASK